MNRQVPGSPVTHAQSGLACGRFQKRLHPLHKEGAFSFLVKPKPARA